LATSPGAYLDLKVESGQGCEAGDAEPVRLPGHDVEHRRRALGEGGVAGARHRRRAVERTAAVDQERVGLPDPSYGHGREPGRLLVRAVVPPVVEQHVVLAVVRERLGVPPSRRRRDDDEPVEPRRALHPVVGVVHVGARAVDDEGVGEDVAGEDGALRDALGAVGPGRADLPDAVPVDGHVLRQQRVAHPDHDGVALRGADGRAGVCPLMVTASLRTQSGDLNW
jgi:hypothetical protein